MRLVIIALGAAITLLAGLPYLLETVQGTTKPKIASWVAWAALVGVGAASSFAQHQWPAAIYSAVCCIECLAIVVVGFKKGDRRFGRLDVACLIGAALGFAVLVVVKSPALAVTVTVLTDLIGAVPTIMHAWNRPDEETPLTYYLSGCGSLFTLLVANFSVFTAYAYPTYLFLFNLSITIIIALRFGYHGHE